MTREEYQEKLLQVRKTGYNLPKHLQRNDSSIYPQGYFKEKPCRLCRKVFTPQAPSEHYCSEYCRLYAHTEAYYSRVYGLTIQEYLDIAENQNFKCAICGLDNFPMKSCSSGTLVVDHDHKNNTVRGLLCHNCNRALGLLQDNVETLKSAIAYLEGVTTIPQGSTLKPVEAEDMQQHEEIV